MGTMTPLEVAGLVVRDEGVDTSPSITHSAAVQSQTFGNSEHQERRCLTTLGGPAPQRGDAYYFWAAACS